MLYTIKIDMPMDKPAEEIEKKAKERMASTLFSRGDIKKNLVIVGAENSLLTETTKFIGQVAIVEPKKYEELKAKANAYDDMMKRKKE